MCQACCAVQGGADPKHSPLASSLLFTRQRRRVFPLGVLCSVNSPQCPRSVSPGTARHGCLAGGCPSEGDRAAGRVPGGQQLLGDFWVISVSPPSGAALPTVRLLSSAPRTSWPWGDVPRASPQEFPGQNQHPWDLPKHGGSDATPHPRSEALGRTQGSACLQPWETLMHTQTAASGATGRRAGLAPRGRASRPAPGSRRRSARDSSARLLLLEPALTPRPERHWPQGSCSVPCSVPGAERGGAKEPGRSLQSDSSLSRGPGTQMTEGDEPSSRMHFEKRAMRHPGGEKQTRRPEPEPTVDWKASRV